jgi:plastocyanin domain-containing protein
MAPKILRLSGVIVLSLGVIMFNRGMLLTGTGYDFTTGLAWVNLQIRERWGKELPELPLDVQKIETVMGGEGSDGGTIVLKKGVPVQWKIHNQDAQFCASQVLVPKLGLDVGLKNGDQTIEFTPQQAGVITWSCNMGMNHGTFVVVEEADKNEANPREGKLK